jgi:hypothetical protein
VTALQLKSIAASAKKVKTGLDVKMAPITSKPNNSNNYVPGFDRRKSNLKVIGSFLA